MKLSPNEIRDITNLLEAGKPLPEKYRFVLFGEQRNVELVWDGKSSAITDVHLPFQVIEQVDEPRSEKFIETQLGLFDSTSGRQLKGWSNKLIWGDNKFILSSLRSGSIRDEIDKNGGIKFVYIDPPFDVGADFTLSVEVGNENFEKKPSVLEELAYRDTWGKGSDSYMSMIYNCIQLVYLNMAEDGVFCLHCDWRVVSQIRLICDEIFGKQNFINQVVWWYYNKMHPAQNRFGRNHDYLICYSKQEKYKFTIQKEERDKPTKQQKRVFDSATKRAIQSRDSDGNLEYYIETHRTIDDVWKMPYLMPADKTENLRYPTQKPEKLIGRLIEAFTNEGDIVADFFSGSGTTAAVSEKLNRKWIVSDIGKFSIHTIRKRMITVQRELKENQKNWRAFEILNLGKYERGMLIAKHSGLESDKQIEEIQLQKDKQFEKLILSAYKATEIAGNYIFVGSKNNRLIAVGPLNLPVTRLFVETVMKECKKIQATKADIVAFEYEMGLFPNIQDESRKLGIDLAFKYIPRDIFDKRAVSSGQVKFHDVAYIEVKPIVQGNHLTIELIDYSVGYQQESIQSAEKELSKSGVKIVVDNGQVVKLERDKNGIFTRTVLTKHWSDWIDYWAIDWDFANRKEIVNIKNKSTGEIETQWTGDFIFENEWQSFRTQKNREIEFRSATKEMPNGVKKVAVKVVDIFGNDTMKIIEVKVGK